MERSIYKYTVCFLTRGEQLLMLYRHNPPNKGYWNGVGGHIEPGEIPLASCLREVFEETGYRLEALRFGGLLTWEGFEIDNGGLFIFTAEAPPGEPLICNEGTLQWHTRKWALTSPQVVSNIHYFLPQVLNGLPPQVYHFVYNEGNIIHHQVRCMKDDNIALTPAFP